MTREIEICWTSTDFSEREKKKKDNCGNDVHSATTVTIMKQVIQ